MSSTLLDRARDDVREFLLLETALRRSSGLTLAQRAGVHAYSAAARRRLGAAKTLREPNDSPGSLLLYREALSCLARAVLIAEGAAVDVARIAPEVAWESLEHVLQDRKSAPPPDIDVAARAFASVDPLAFDRLTPEEAARALESLEVTARWLADLIEPRSPKVLARTRTVRVTAAAALSCVLLALLVFALLSPKNVALNKPVFSTPPGYDTTAAGAVDGEKNGSFGFHSQEAESPYLTIDLQRTYLVNTIKVFGRGDCCFEQSIPLAVEVSADDVSFRRLAERTLPYSETDPWLIAAGGAPARFVRVRSERRTVLVLSEVEVYGKAKM